MKKALLPRVSCRRTSAVADRHECHMSVSKYDIRKARPQALRPTTHSRAAERSSASDLTRISALADRAVSQTRSFSMPWVAVLTGRYGEQQALSEIRTRRHCRERVQDPGGQWQAASWPPPDRIRHLNSSTVAKGVADHGRKRLSVNFVGFPAFTSTRRRSQPTLPKLSRPVGVQGSRKIVRASIENSMSSRPLRIAEPVRECGLHLGWVSVSPRVNGAGLNVLGSGRAGPPRSSWTR